MPRPSRVLRLLAFTVPALLALCAAQPLLASATGAVKAPWALGLALPGLAAALLLFVAGRIGDTDSRQPRWFAAWALLPGAFLLAGAASMCIYGALVEYAPVRTTFWLLTAAGVAAWTAGLALVRLSSSRGR